MSFWDRFRRPAEPIPLEATIDTDVPPKELGKVLKIKSFPVNAQISSGRGVFEDAPYDFEKILKAYQTDSILKSAISKYSELMWKGGFDLISENPKAREYLQQRLDVMSVFMKQPFEQFLREVTESLFLFHNVFIIQARGPWDQYVQGLRAEPQFGNTDPIVGYYILPTQTVKVMRDKNNRPKKYQQGVQTSGKAPEFKPEEVIHLAVDRKPGTIFGEPFIENVLEDLLALRQLEEDILNLTHRELFPLMIYTVGTENARAEEGEVEDVRNELENMRTDSGLVIPWRHAIDIKGSEGEAMNINDYLKYFRQRVVTGTGLSEVHLGIMDVANRAVTERLDIGLYDKVKTYQRLFEGHVTLLMFNELLLEGGFDPYETPLLTSDADRVSMHFGEIDTESQVKRENNTVFKWVSNAITHEEMREELGLDPISPEEEKRLQAQMILLPMQAMAAMSRAPDGTSSGQTQPKSPNQAKPKSKSTSSSGAANKSQPRNQYGTRLAPKITHGSLLPPDINESESSLGDILHRIGAHQSPREAAEEEFENLVSYAFEQAETGLWRSLMEYGGALLPGWLEEITGAGRTRIHSIISLYQQQLDASGVLLPIAIEMLNDSIQRLGWNFRQAGYLYGAAFSLNKEVQLSSGSEGCEICEQVCGQVIDRDYITFERLLAVVHSPCSLKLDNL
jgi:hypothetical protein